MALIYVSLFPPLWGKKKKKEPESSRTAKTSSITGCAVAVWQTLWPAGRQIKKASWRLTIIGASHPTPLEPQHFAPKTPLLPGAPKCPLSLAKWKIMDPKRPPSAYLLVCMSQTLWLRPPAQPTVTTCVCACALASVHTHTHLSWQFLANIVITISGYRKK